MSSRPAHERVLDAVLKLPAVDGGCWLWMGAMSGTGYGAIRVEGRVEYVHRVMARHHHGDIDGMAIDHLCRVRNCVNPDHLAVVTLRENSWRSNSDVWKRFAAHLVAQINAERAA